MSEGALWFLEETDIEEKSLMQEPSRPGNQQEANAVLSQAAGNGGSGIKERGPEEWQGTHHMTTVRTTSTIYP